MKTEKELKEEIWNDIFSWESCEEVKSPSDTDKIEFAIEQAFKKTKAEVKHAMTNFFINEDKILKKVDKKMASLMVSRGISHEKERNELIKLRKELLQKLDN